METDEVGASPLMQGEFKGMVMKFRYHRPDGMSRAKYQEAREMIT